MAWISTRPRPESQKAVGPCKGLEALRQREVLREEHFPDGNHRGNGLGLAASQQQSQQQELGVLTQAAAGDQEPSGLALPYSTQADLSTQATDSPDQSNECLLPNPSPQTTVGPVEADLPLPQATAPAAVNGPYLTPPLQQRAEKPRRLTAPPSLPQSQRSLPNDSQAPAKGRDAQKALPAQGVPQEQPLPRSQGRQQLPLSSGTPQARPLAQEESSKQAAMAAQGSGPHEDAVAGRSVPTPAECGRLPAPLDPVSLATANCKRDRHCSAFRFLGRPIISCRARCDL